jgi:dTDP-4-dehydrorhamnose reductase
MLCNVPGIDLTCNEIWAENWPGLLDRKLVPVVRATFVSMLLPLHTIERHGAPIPDMFIWGDDVEYAGPDIRRKDVEFMARPKKRAAEAALF